MVASEAALCWLGGTKKTAYVTVFSILRYLTTAMLAQTGCSGVAKDHDECCWCREVESRGEQPKKNLRFVLTNATMGFKGCNFFRLGPHASEIICKWSYQVLTGCCCWVGAGYRAAARGVDATPAHNLAPWP